jgi:hypothetical protein
MHAILGLGIERVGETTGTIALSKRSRDDILSPPIEPEPPAEEPMTIDKIGDKLRARGCVLPKVTQSRYLWCDFDTDLAALVEAQVRRDAEIIRIHKHSTLDELAEAILKAAGLK